MTKQTTKMSPIEEARKSALKTINERLPSIDYEANTFKLLKGKQRIVRPKFIYKSEKGNKIPIRYSKTENSIFADEQAEPVNLEYINFDQQLVVRDKNLLHFMLLHPQYGKLWKLNDPNKDAEQELDKVSRFDQVWDSLRQLDDQTLIGVYLMLPETGRHTLEGLSQKPRTLLLMGLRKIAESQPDKVREVLEDPVLKTLYMYHMAVGIGILQYIPRREAIVWTDSKKEVCKVPVNKDPGMHLARLLLTDDFVQARELLEQQLND